MRLRADLTALLADVGIVDVATRSMAHLNMSSRNTAGPSREVNFPGILPCCG
jgi:hypothetical protein